MRPLGRVLDTPRARRPTELPAPGTHCGAAHVRDGPVLDPEAPRPMGGARGEKTGSLPGRHHTRPAREHAGGAPDSATAPQRVPSRPRPEDKQKFSRGQGVSQGKVPGGA